VLDAVAPLVERGIERHAGIARKTKDMFDTTFDENVDESPGALHRVK
jgi:hypothetical protein